MKRQVGADQVRLFLACLVHGVAVVMQHPARQGGRQARVPEVWKSAYIHVNVQRCGAIALFMPSLARV